MNSSVKHDKSKLENYTYCECRNSVNRFHSNNKNTSKNLHYILDDDSDDDGLIKGSINLYNHFTTSILLYEHVNNNNLLNKEEHNHEDDNINYKNYPMLNITKNEYIVKWKKLL